MFFVQMLRGSTYVNDAGGDTRRLTKLSPHLDISTVNEEKEHAQLSFQLEKTKVYDTSLKRRKDVNRKRKKFLTH